MINWNNIHKRILAADRILLTTHENPDGDGLGSASAMYYFLKGYGKECRIVNCSPLPLEFSFLNKDNIFETFDLDHHKDWIKSADLVLIFDVGDYRRLRALKPLIEECGLDTINIDHHPYPEEVPFTVNMVNTSAAATGEMLYDYFTTVSTTPMSLEIAEGIYTAILTDTGSFRYSNTNARCHEIAIACMQAGINHTAIYQKVYETNSLPRVKLLGQILSNLNLEEQGELAWFTIDESMLGEANATKSDVDGFTDYVRTIRGVEVALMIFEQAPEICRINFRSKGKYIVNEIAGSFGGGGHQLAAGAVISGSLVDILPKVLKQTRKIMNQQNGQIK